ncbi:MAG: hypothetical protein ACLQB4_11905 [Beijerinckiaceae bacterium]
MSANQVSGVKIWCSESAMCSSQTRGQALMRRGFSNAAPQWRAIIDGGASSLTISAEIEDIDALIVFDPARLRQGESGSERGDIGVFEGDEMDSFLTGSQEHSVHEVGLFDLLACAFLSGNLLRRRAHIGIEPQFVEWGEQPTKAGSSPAEEAQ